MPVESLLRLSKGISRFVDFVGRWGALFILPLVFFTIWDVLFRKVGKMQVWLMEASGPVGFLFDSTIIQELEWHFHTALFALVLGYGYVNNRHVRVDLLREKLTFRNQAIVEFIGCTFFLIPYTVLVVYFAGIYAYEAFITNEISASLVGLPMRWIIKSTLFFGLIVAALASLAVWIETVLVLFGPRELRFPLMTMEWPEDQARRAEAARKAQEQAAVEA